MRRILTLVILALVLVGCSAGLRLPSAQPGITGQIQEIKESRILVKGPLAPGAANPRLVWVTITAKTEIAKDGKKAEKLAAADLKVDDKVQVWFSGGVRESYPEQADASFILVVQ